MIDMNRKSGYLSRCFATALIGVSLVAWPGPLMPKAIRSLAPDTTVMHDLGNGSVAHAGRRGGGGRSFSAPRGSGGSYGRSGSNRRSYSQPQSGSFRGSGGSTSWAHKELIDGKMEVSALSEDGVWLVLFRGSEELARRELVLVPGEVSEIAIDLDD